MSTQARISATGLAIWLGITAAILPSVLAPAASQAYTARVSVAIDRQNDESYEALVQRAELVARAATQRSFDRDILINDVAIMIIAQSQGVEVPILTVDVSRQQWRSRPDLRRWATYYKTAKTLLRLDGVAVPGSFPRAPQAPIAPRVAPQAAPPRPQTPLPPSTPRAAPSNTGTPRSTSPNSPPNNRSTPATAQPVNPNISPEDQTEDNL